jgi:hypothetical protein
MISLTSSNERPHQGLASSHSWCLKMLDQKKYGIAKPKRIIWDPYIGSSTGHQTTESPHKPAAWRHRNIQRVNKQFSERAKWRLEQQTGAEMPDETKDVDVPKQKTIFETWNPRVSKPRDKSMQYTEQKTVRSSTSDPSHLPILPHRPGLSNVPSTIPEQDPQHQPQSLSSSSIRKRIFQNITVHISGSTLPVISDHRLRTLLSQHGATISPFLLRRSVTHVICSPKSVGGGCFAGGKMHKEAIAARRMGIRFVTAEWAVESVKHGKRLTEADFRPNGLERGSASVMDVFEKKQSS